MVKLVEVMDDGRGGYASVVHHKGRDIRAVSKVAGKPICEGVWSGEVVGNEFHGYQCVREFEDEFAYV